MYGIILGTYNVGAPLLLSSYVEDRNHHPISAQPAASWSDDQQETMWHLLVGMLLLYTISYDQVVLSYIGSRSDGLNKGVVSSFVLADEELDCTRLTR